MTRGPAASAAVAAVLVVCLATACSHGKVAERPPVPSPQAPLGSLPTGLSAASAAMAHYLDGLASSGRFSGAVLVARDGHVLLDAGYGLADRATRTPNAPGTIFQIGSVTKQFTAMAIAILAASGRLRLDAPACEYLPGCPPSWKAITLTELLTHTSGIENWSAWHLTGPLPGEVTDPIAAIVTEAEREPLAFPPGTQASYSNPAYVVLGDIIERVSGMGYGAFLQSHIFAPLGMGHTGLLQGQVLGPGHALGYLGSGAVAPTGLTAAASAAGAIYSRTGDLYRWDQGLITGNPRLVPPSLLGQILTVHAPCPYRSCPLAADRGYGYGWFVGGAGAARLMNHSGSVVGFWSYNGFYPARDIVVVILSNLDTVQINPISARLNQLGTTLAR